MKTGGLWEKVWGKKTLLDLDRLNYKEYTNHRLMKFTRTFTHIFYSLLFNAVFSFGWYAIARENNFTTFEQISNYSSYLGYGIGHVTYNAAHWIYNRFTRDKYHKTETRNGNPIPKIGGFSIALTVIALIPSIVWLIGKIIVVCKQKKYLSVNGNFVRLENDIIKQQQINNIVTKNTKSVASDLSANIVKQLTKDVKDTFEGE